MKKLGKLSINQSKLLENEELVNLRGGYSLYGLIVHKCTCTTYNPAYNTNGVCKHWDSSTDMADYLFRACASGGVCNSVTSC